MILSPTKKNIHICADILKKEGIVAFPTETVYGLGANALSKKGVEKIFNLKKRPSFNPIIIHIDSLEKINLYAHLSNQENKIIEKISCFLPGPLTLLVRKKSIIPNITTANSHLVAIRIPSNAIALELIKEANLPLAAPSANISGKVSPTTASEVQFYFPNIYILDGGKCLYGIESTVLNITEKVATIVRPGAITKEMLENCGINVSYALNNSPTISSPGQLKDHYQPNTPLISLSSFFNLKTFSKKTCYIAFNKKNLLKYQCLFTHTVLLSEDENLEKIAKNLYTALQNCDKGNFDLIVIDILNKNKGLAFAINDRITKAIKKNYIPE